MRVWRFKVLDFKTRYFLKTAYLSLIDNEIESVEPMIAECPSSLEANRRPLIGGSWIDLHLSWISTYR